MSHKLSIKDIKSPDKFFKSMLGFVKYLRHNVKLYLIFSSIVAWHNMPFFTLNAFAVHSWCAFVIE